jgi:hypothetical protein
MDEVRKSEDLRMLYPLLCADVETLKSHKWRSTNFALLIHSALVIVAKSLSGETGELSVADAIGVTILAGLVSVIAIVMNWHSLRSLQKARRQILKLHAMLEQEIRDRAAFNAGDVSRADFAAYLITCVQFLALVAGALVAARITWHFVPALS